VQKLREEPRVKDWVTEVTAQQNKMINFLLVAYGVLLCATMSIFFLQGFHAWGFVLDASLLKWLGGATIGEIAGLLAIAFKAVFGQKALTKPKTKNTK
jgi:hypothetical protein